VKEAVMATVCSCEDSHLHRRIVLTGGPGAGKTAVLELVRQYFCEHVHVLPEAAGIVFGGGFPRDPDAGSRRAAQRAIFHVQRELEAAAQARNAAIVLCDRGTVDGAAYWPGPSVFWTEVGTTLSDELARYDAVIHLCSPSERDGYNRGNPLRVESPTEAAAVDHRLREAWQAHPHRFVIPAAPDFLAKAAHVLGVLRDHLPECCRNHHVPEVDDIDRDELHHG
jgi:predicted ATPase